MFGLGVDVWVEDSEEGKIFLNEIELIDEARRAGYPIPSDEWLINYMRNQEDDD